MRRWMMVTTLAAVLAAGGCGGDEGSGADSGDPAETRVEAFGTPAAEDCAPDVLETDVAADDLVTPKGTYSYTVEGTRGSEGAKTALASPIDFEFSGVRKIGELRCFSARRAYTPQLADEATIVVRGSDIHLTRLRTTIGGRTMEIVPEPPVKTLDGDAGEWSGTFDGPTRGTYAGENLGRKTFRVDGKRMQAVGVEFRLALDGELRGTSVTRTWFALDDNLVLEEKTEQDRSAGGERLTLDFVASYRGEGK